MKKYSLIFILLLFSCNRNVVYSEFNKDFENNRWYNNDVKTFHFSIENEANYTIRLHLGHIFGFPITDFPVLVGINNEEKDIYMDIVNVKIIDKNGKHLGDCLGDICDVYAVILTQKLEKGNYTIKIGNSLQSSDSQHQYLPYILGVGIDVNKED